MRTLFFRSLVLATAWLAAFVSSGASAQEDRRGVLKTPGLVLETGTPTAPVLALAFAGDGKHLVAAGADKVARVWSWDGAKLDQPKGVTLRWPSWREQRGIIIAMALSPDPEARYVAVGGHGLVTGVVVVFDRTTEKIVHALTVPNLGEVVSALAFSSSGKTIAIGTSGGNVGRWDLQGAKKDDVAWLGKHAGEGENRVRMVAFQAEGQIVSVAMDGSLGLWPRPAGPAAPKPLRFDLDHVEAAVASPDRQWLAAVGWTGKQRTGKLEIRSVGGQKLQEYRFPAGSLPVRLAAGARGELLAIGVEATSAAAVPFKLLGATVWLYDVKARRPGDFRPAAGFNLNALAVHPEEKHVAVAGGDDFEIAVWDLENQEKAAEVRSPGRAIWDVGLSADGRFLGFCEQRNKDPKGVNDWGTKTWRVYDLKLRGWAARPDEFRPVGRLVTVGGWRVETDTGDPAAWRVVGPDGRPYDLRFNPFVEIRPWCYTMLRPVDGRPARLVVGHHYGASIYDLTPEGPQRTRILVGHADDVTCLAVSADQKTLVTAGRDQTVAAWSLADWPNQRELGAAFELRGGKLFVRAVAAGSPSWEAGLTEGDEVVLLAFNGQGVQGGAAAWLERLRDPTPGKELFFRVNRPGQAKPVEMLTTVRQRPLWKFFATHDDEWVLWRWRDYFYDASAIGDSYIGWQINGGPGDTPEFHQAEKFRKMFHRPEKLADLIAEVPSDPERIELGRFLPPRVEVTLQQPGPPEKNLIVQIRVSARGEDPQARPTELTVWLNEFQAKPWTPIGPQAQVTVKIPTSKLRSGVNRLVVQAKNASGVRSDSQPLAIVQEARGGRPRVLGLFVGISDYSAAAPGPKRERLWQNLFFASDDAKEIARLWRQQAGARLFQAEQGSLLLEKAATRQAVIEQLDRLAQTVEPDDLFVLFLAGHGWARQIRPNVFQPGTFTFVCPTFDVTRPADTGLTGEEIYRKVAQLPCRKLLLLDCCHAGSTSVLRALSPDGVGPVILAACDVHQASFDIPYLGHGAFTNSLIEALGEKFASVDRDEDGMLRVKDLWAYVRTRVPHLVVLARPVVGADAAQNPRAFIPSGMEDMAVAYRPTEAAATPK